MGFFVCRDSHAVVHARRRRENFKQARVFLFWWNASYHSICTRESGKLHGTRGAYSLAWSAVSSRPLRCPHGARCFCPLVGEQRPRLSFRLESEAAGSWRSRVMTEELYVRVYSHRVHTYVSIDTRTATTTRAYLAYV